MSTFDVQAIRAQFPILSREVNGKPLAYFDSAASAHKPQSVIDAQSRYLAHTHSNIHRGVRDRGHWWRSLRMGSLTVDSGDGAGEVRWVAVRDRHARALVI